MAAGNTLSDVLTPAAVETLQAFSEHMGAPQAWRLVGGAAIRFWTGRGGLTDELDVATTMRLADLPSTASPNSAFDAIHMHTHYGALGHRATGRKVDVFTAMPNEPPADMVLFGRDGLFMPVRDRDALFVVSLRWLLRHVETDYGFGPHAKRIAAAEALGEVVDWEAAENLWYQWATKPAEVTVGVRDAMDWAITQARGQGSARRSVFGHRIKQVVGDCSDCYRRDPNHPLASSLTVVRRRLGLRIGQTLSKR